MLSKFKRLLIDGDIVVYRCGFASHKRIYTVQPQGLEFSKIADIKEWCEKENKDYKSLEIEKQEFIEPVEHSLQNVRTFIDGIIDKMKCNALEIYLSGKPNWRESLGTLKKYKGNRDPEHKPEHYDEIIRFLKRNYEAITTEGIEADDALALGQEGEDTCIVSLDKDLDQIPGWHYNWVKDDLYFITEDDGIRKLYHQMLTGDATDNILGIPNVGKKKADKILSHIGEETTGNELRDALESLVQFQYETFFDDELCLEYGYTSWEEIYDENMVLLKIGDVDKLEEKYNENLCSKS